MPTRVLRSLAFSGASESEQLPGTTEVIPCSSAGFAAPSQSSWTSKCVCGSMKPGATTWPLASITRLASPRSAPTAAMRPALTATSAAKAGAPVPSTTRPPLISRSYIRKSLRNLAPGAADQAVQVGRAAGAHDGKAGVRVQHHLADDPVLVADGKRQLGCAIVAGGDLGALDDRFGGLDSELADGSGHAAIGGSTNTTSEPKSRPRGRRMAKMCRFQLWMRSTAVASGSPGSARAASASTVSSGSGVTNRRWGVSGIEASARRNGTRFENRRKAPARQWSKQPISAAQPAGAGGHPEQHQDHGGERPGQAGGPRHQPDRRGA